MRGENKALNNQLTIDSVPTLSPESVGTASESLADSQHRFNGSEQGPRFPSSDKTLISTSETVQPHGKLGVDRMEGALGVSASKEHSGIAAKSKHGAPTELSLLNSVKSTVASNDSQSSQIAGLAHMGTNDPVSTDAATVLTVSLGMEAETISSLVADNLMQGISTEIAQRLRDGVSELTLQLKPESLGEMRLKVGIVDDMITAQVHVTGAEVKTALEANILQLRDGLASRGIEVQRIEIFTVGDAPARESRGQQEARQRASSRRRDGDSVEERYKGTRLMGYNTIEMVM
jgi:flagellar hook-length control protein FliK